MATDEIIQQHRLETVNARTKSQRNAFMPQ